MGNPLITWSIGIVGLFMFAFVIVVVGLMRRKHYLEETKEKIKAVFLGKSNKPDTQVLPIEPSGIEIKAPKGHTVGTYFISKEAQWQTDYPEKPFAGLYWLQVPIATSYYGVDNPEPMTPNKHNDVATASQIFNSGDNTFSFAARQAKAELDKERNKVEKNKLNPMYVYVGLVLIVALSAAALFISNGHGTLLQQILEAVG
jgi:hypothetical protein